MCAKLRSIMFSLIARYIDMNMTQKNYEVSKLSIVRLSRYRMCACARQHAVVLARCELARDVTAAVTSQHVILPSPPRYITGK